MLEFSDEERATEYGGRERTIAEDEGTAGKYRLGKSESERLDKGTMERR